MMINLRHQTIYNSGNDPLNILKNILIVLAVLLTKKEQKLCSFSLIIPEIVLAHSELNHNVQSEWSIQNESMLSSIVSNINGQPAPNFMLISARCERCCTTQDALGRLGRVILFSGRCHLLHVRQYFLLT